MEYRVIGFFSLLGVFLVVTWIIALNTMSNDDMLIPGGLDYGIRVHIDKMKGSNQKNVVFKDDITTTSSSDHPVAPIQHPENMGIDVSAATDPIATDQDESLLLNKTLSDTKPAKRSKEEKSNDHENEHPHEQELDKKMKNSAVLLYKTNPFRKLAAYTKSLSSDEQFKRDNSSSEEIASNPYYCDLVDTINFFEYERFFEEKNYYTDAIPHEKKAQGFEQLLNGSTRIQIRNSKVDPNIQVFFTQKSSPYILEALETNTFCVSQQYSAVFNDSGLNDIFSLLPLLSKYEQKWPAESNTCFNKSAFAPKSYRLNEQTDCSSFFTTIAEELENEKPIDYILRIVDKSGDKSTQRLDAEKMKKFLEKYNSEMCEEKNTLNDTQIVVQKMLNNMLLLDGSSEFVLKSFMMISSTNPLIVHYHDGYLKVLKTNGEGKSKSLQEDIDQLDFVQNSSWTVMTYDQLAEKILSKKNAASPSAFVHELRKKLQVASIHLARSVAPELTKRSGNFRVYELEFFMDSDLSPWLLGVKKSPDFSYGGSSEETKLLQDLFEIQFAYLKSRMKRVFQLVTDYLGSLDPSKVQEDPKELAKYQNTYQLLSRDFLENDFNYSPNNTWTKILDLNDVGEGVFQGLLGQNCA